MLKKSIFYCFASMLLVSVLGTPGFAGMTADRVSIAHTWPTIAGVTRQVETYVDPNSPTGTTGAGQRVQENFDGGRAVTQSFTNPITNDGFNLRNMVITDGGATGDEDNVFTLHLFDLDVSRDASGGGSGLPVWQLTGGYRLDNDAMPPRYDWFSTDCEFIFWPDANLPDPNDYFVIFNFTEYDSMDIEPNHLYTFEIWGPDAALAGMYWIRDAVDNGYLYGRAYECSGTADGPDPGVGPPDLSATRSGIAGSQRDMTLAVYGVLADGNAFHPLPRDYEPEADVSPVLKWSPGKWVASTQGHQLWLSTAKAFVDNRMPGANKGKMDANEYPAGTLAFETTYYWRVDEYNSVSKPGSYWGGPVWRFTTIGPKARKPVPTSGRTAEFSLTSFNLSWTKGAWAADIDGHRVYFGIDFNEVNDAATDTPTIYRGQQTPDSYNLLDLAGDYTLEGGSTYYWRIDEVNDGTAGSPWKGPVWNFTMPTFVVVDSFVYGSQADMNSVWKSSGGSVSNCLACSMSAGVSATLTGGTMRFKFDNRGTTSECPWSEVKADNNGAGLGMDWTISGIVNTASLAIGIDGNIASAIDPEYDNLYMAVEDSAGNLGIVYCDDTIIQKRQFGSTERNLWNISLAEIANSGTPNPVDLTDINVIYIGTGPRCDWGSNGQWGPFGGTGVIAIDNIRLYMPRCLTEYGGHNGPAGSADLAGVYNGAENWMPGDCIVNLFDIDYMFHFNSDTDTRHWLDTDVTLNYTGATAPLNDSSHLMVWYKFDTETGTSGTVTVIDSSGNARHGTLGNPHKFVWASDGASGQCLNTEAGLMTWVKVPTSAYPDPNNNPSVHGVTFSFWTAADMNYEMTGLLNAEWPSVLMMHSKEPNEANAFTTADDGQMLETQFPTPWPPNHQWGPQLRFVDQRNGSGPHVGRPGSPWVRPDHFGRRWNHYAITFDDVNRIKEVWENGVRAAVVEHNFVDPNDVNVPLPLWPEPGSLRLCTRSNRYYDPSRGFTGPNWGFWYGKLDEFRIYNYRLHEDEIQWLATNGAPTRALNIEDNANLNNDNAIDFKDFAILAQKWLAPAVLWP